MLIFHINLLVIVNYRRNALKCSQKLRHRGPDGTGYHQTNMVVFHI